MWPPPTAMNHGAPPLNKLIAVAIDKDRGSQIALKWAVDNLLARGQTIILIHVKVKASGTPFSQSGNRINQDGSNDGPGMSELDPQLKELLLPFRVFCTRKDIQYHDVVLEDSDVVKAIIEYINRTAIEVLILGAAAKDGLLRSPFTHRKGPNGKPYEISQPDTDISFVSSGRPSIPIS